MNELLKSEIKADPDQLIKLFLVNMVRNNISLVLEIHKRIELPMDAMLSHANTPLMIRFAYWAAKRRGLSFTTVQITRAFNWHICVGHYASAMILSRQADFEYLSDNAMQSLTLCLEGDGVETVRPSTDWIRIILLPFVFGITPTQYTIYKAAKYVNPIATLIYTFLFDAKLTSFQCGQKDNITAIILLERYIKIDWSQVLLGAASRNHTSLMYICRTKVQNMDDVLTFVRHQRLTDDMELSINLLKLWGLF